MGSPPGTERFRQLNRLLEAALVLEPSERSAWLDSLQGPDAELRPMLAELLGRAAMLDESTFLRPLQDLRASELLSEAGELEQQPGEVSGPYRLVQELGRGGMGTVWLAERVDGTMKRKVALKLPHQGVSRSLLSQRLVRERDILSSLEHPNIARLYDAGVSEDGQPFLALEYVDGTPIDRYCRDGALDLSRRLELIVQVCQAVAHAHAHLVLHRDLKPSNILVTPNGQVRLLDFGVAKLLQEGADRAEETALTQVGGRALTPEYASPEQISHQPLSTASDVYSLGVVLYELLTGQRPYQLKRGSLGELEEAILTTEPARPSRVADEGTRRSLSGDLDTIVLKALQKSPSARYSTVSALLDDIERFRAGMPVLARPDSAWYRLRKFVHRHRLLVSAASAVVAAVLLGAGAALWQARLARVEAGRARESAEEARFEARASRASQEILSQILSDAMRGGETEAMRDRLDRARELLRRRFTDEPVIRALLLLEMAGRYDELKLYDREDEVMKEFDALAEETADPSLLAIRECIAAYDAITSGKLDQARPRLDRGLFWMSKTSHPRNWAPFECLRADAMLAVKSGEHARAVGRMQELLGRLERDGLGKTTTYLAALGSLAYIHEMGGEYVQALETSRRRIALDELLGSQSSLGADVERDRSSQLLLVLGRLADGWPRDRALLEEFRQNGRSDLSHRFLTTIAQKAVEANELALARPLLAWLVASAAKTGPPLATVASHVLMAELELQSGRLDAAEAQLSQAGAVTGGVSPRWQVHANRMRLALAEKRGDHTARAAHLAALRSNLGAIADPVRAFPGDRLAVVQGKLDVGRAELAGGDVEAAARSASETLDLARLAVLPGKTSAWVGAAKLLQAKIALSTGQLDEAHRLARDAEQELVDNLSPAHPLRVEAAALVADDGDRAR
jgi:serine/threonine-protein kinase